MGPGWHPAHLGSGACVWGQLWVRRPLAYAALCQPVACADGGIAAPSAVHCQARCRPVGRAAQGGRAGETGLSAPVLGPCPSACTRGLPVCACTCLRLHTCA